MRSICDAMRASLRDEDRQQWSCFINEKPLIYYQRVQANRNSNQQKDANYDEKIQNVFTKLV